MNCITELESEWSLLLPMCCTLDHQTVCF